MAMNKKLYELHEAYGKHNLVDTGIRLRFQTLCDMVLLCSCGVMRVKDSHNGDQGQDIACIHSRYYLGILKAACTPALRKKILAYKKFKGEQIK
jgi:hypothetical protein